MQKILEQVKEYVEKAINTNVRYFDIQNPVIVNFYKDKLFKNLDTVTKVYEHEGFITLLNNVCVAFAQLTYDCLNSPYFKTPMNINFSQNAVDFINWYVEYTKNSVVPLPKTLHIESKIGQMFEILFNNIQEAIGSTHEYIMTDDGCSIKKIVNRYNQFGFLQITINEDDLNPFAGLIFVISAYLYIQQQIDTFKTLFPEFC